MKPSMKSLEKIVSEFPDYVPNKLILLGSYAIVARIFIDKGIDVELYRDTKDLDAFLFSEDEKEFLKNATDMVFTEVVGHYKVGLEDITLELFTDTSYSGLVGENYSGFLDFLLEKDKEGKYIHLDELKIGNRILYVPNVSALIFMKVRAYGKRMYNNENDRTIWRF